MNLEPSDTAAAVLAAGASSRMGRPKALVSAGAMSFLERTLSSIRGAGIEDIYLVINDSSPEIEKTLTGLKINGLKTIINREWRLGQLSSLQKAVGALGEGAEALLMCLIDHPMVRSETISGLLGAFSPGGTDMVKPVYRGRAGHPVLISRALFPALLEADPAAGARSVFSAEGLRCVRLDVQDAAVLQDIDCEEDIAIYGLEK